MCVCLWVLNFLWEPTEETLARGVSYDYGRGDRIAVQVERSDIGAYQGGRPRHVGSWATAGTVLSACTRTRVRALDDLDAWLKLTTRSEDRADPDSSDCCRARRQTGDPCQTCLAQSRACACHAATDSCLHRNDSRLDSCCNRQGERRYTFTWHLRRFVLWRTASPEISGRHTDNLDRELS